jgi:DNA-binding MarR family transcriptional regulator
MVRKPAYSSTSVESIDPKAVLEVCLCHGIRRASRAITRTFDAALAPSGLTSGQFGILAAVAALQPMPVPVLRGVLAMDRTSLNRSLKPMEVNGLIAITPGAGRRASQVEMTPEGVQAFREAAALWRAAQSDAAQRLGTTRIGQLIAGLDVATALFDR